MSNIKVSSNRVSNGDAVSLIGSAMGRLVSEVDARALRSAVASFVAVMTLCACSSDERFAYVERPVEVLYNLAMDNLEKRRYADAIALFDEVERQHPYSAWARRGMLMSAFASYQQNDYDDAVVTIDRFIALHPGNQYVDYAYYLKAISYYEQIVDVGRDQDKTVEAVNALNEVVRRFPASEYSRDARLKIDLTQDHLAGKEMDVGRFYLGRNKHIAAINRFKTVLIRYQTTSHVPEALHRLVEANLELGLADEAQSAAAVLGYNYPGSSWYRESYRLLASRDLEPAEEPDGNSWIARRFGRIF